jgi:outer membrane protein W
MLRRIGIVAAILVVAVSASAEVGYNDFLLTGTGAYVMGKSKDTGETLDGASFALTFESVGSGDMVSFGLSFAYAVMEYEQNDAGLVSKQEIRTFPIYLMGRGWFGTGKFQGYLGGAFGVYFSELKTTLVSDQTTTTRGMSGTGLSVPVGVIFNINERVFLNANYTSLAGGRVGRRGPFWTTLSGSFQDPSPSRTGRQALPGRALPGRATTHRRPLRR